MKKKLLVIVGLLLSLTVASALHMSLSFQPDPEDPEVILPVVTVHDAGPGYVYVEYSEDLVNWTPFGMALNVFNTTNSWTFTDHYAVELDEPRFYRARYDYARPIFK